MHIKSLNEEMLTNIWPELENHLARIHIIDHKHTQYSVIPTEILVDEILNAKNNGKTKFIFNLVHEGVILKTLEKIQEIAELIKDTINSNDLIYITGGVDGREVYENLCIEKKWINKITVICGNAQWWAIGLLTTVRNIPVKYEVRQKEKLFLSFNKMPRPHRVDLLEMLLEYNYLDKSFFSFEGPTYWTTYGFVFSDTDYPNIRKNNLHLNPLRLNITDDRPNPTDIKQDDMKYFEESYFSIVTETSFYDSQSHGVNSMFMTEKVLKCFACMHPFILLARPHSLAELRRLGYKTFTPLIDESYDTIEDDKERLNCIFNEIHRLMAKTPEEWIDWQNQIKEIVEYNFNHLHALTDYSSTKNIEKYFI